MHLLVLGGQILTHEKTRKAGETTAQPNTPHHQTTKQQRILLQKNNNRFYNLLIYNAWIYVVQATVRFV